MRTTTQGGKKAISHDIDITGCIEKSANLKFGGTRFFCFNSRTWKGYTCEFISSLMFLSVYNIYLQIQQPSYSDNCILAASTWCADLKDLQKICT